MPAATPLIVLQLPLLRAFEPRTGQLVWETLVGEAEDLSTSPGRLFVTQHGLYVMAGAHVWLIDPADGTITAGIDLPFSPDTALFDGDCFYVAAVPDTAAVGRDGTLRWKLGVERELWSGARLVCRNAAGEKLWERSVPQHAQEAAAGMALGELVSQPDDKGAR
jgi:outer membrane protein assembly factor BamB